MENALTVKVINGSTGESKAFEANGLCEESVLQRIALNERKLKVLGGTKRIYRSIRNERSCMGNSY